MELQGIGTSRRGPANHHRERVPALAKFLSHEQRRGDSKRLIERLRGHFDPRNHSPFESEPPRDADVTGDCQNRRARAMLREQARRSTILGEHYDRFEWQMCGQHGCGARRGVCK